jgi:hypothetical protein
MLGGFLFLLHIFHIIPTRFPKQNGLFLQILKFDEFLSHIIRQHSKEGFCTDFGGYTWLSLLLYSPKFSGGVVEVGEFKPRHRFCVRHASPRTDSTITADCAERSSLATPNSWHGRFAG